MGPGHLACLRHDRASWRISEFARPRRGGSCGGQLWAQRRTVDQGQTTVRPRQRLPFRHSAADPSARNSSRVNSKTGERRASVHHLPTEASNGRPKMAISKTAEVRAVCDPDNGEWLQVTPGERFKIRITSSQTMGSSSVIEMFAFPHNAVPLHIHSIDPEHSFVLERMLGFAAGDKIWEA